ncbi:hypothetical protein [Lacihabitans lacunae]|uniref:Transposase n=1 Tax=Lacihabitans lacunae TaxID=1028214 RepID=A0ABV7YQW8_9BACT
MINKHRTDCKAATKFITDQIQPNHQNLFACRKLIWIENTYAHTQD